MLPDNRIRFSSTLIDFNTEVGVTGQDHDNYPAPGQQPRYDWLRLFLIGLLSNQSSFTQPSQCREGTLWFDLNTSTIKIFSNNTWVPLADAVAVHQNDDGSIVTLSDFYTLTSSLVNFKPGATFGGESTNDSVAIIPIPASLQQFGGDGSRPFVWIDGLLIDPRDCEYTAAVNPTSIRLLNGVALQSGQKFTVLMMGISHFYEQSVIV